MRKVTVMAGLLAALLTIAGCGVSSPSKADVADVKAQLAVLPEGWTLTAVHANNSSTVGLSHHLSVNAEYSGEPTTAEVRAMLEAIVAAVPSGARYMIKVWLLVEGGDSRYPNLTTAYREVGLGDTAGKHDVGELYVTRSELAEALESTS